MSQQPVPSRPTAPNANSPQLLTRLVEMVARGIRSTRGLQEALSVEPRTVQYYTRAAEWLGLIDPSGECLLTPLGLEYVYAGRQRPQVYAAAVRANPLAAELLAASGPDRLPSLEDVQKALAASEPDLAPATLRRRASAVRSLIAPAVGRRARAHRRDDSDRQLALPLTPAGQSPVRGFVPQPLAGPPRLDGVAPVEYDPDLYRFVYSVLLQHGELTLGQLRALLDRAGADSAPIGGYVDLALARGDAARMPSGRLVITAEGAARRSLAETTTSIILSDGGYRDWLAALRESRTDRRAAIRAEQLAGRYRPWNRRLLGRPLDPEQLDRDLERVLLDRPLESFPIARRAPEGPIPPVPVEEPYLDAAERAGLAVTLPPHLLQLQGGVAAVNRLLKRARQGTDVELPDLAHRPAVYHGGILHPGEPLPRSVPDTRSLRLRVLMHAPYPAMLMALLLLHRQRSDLAVTRENAGWTVRLGRNRIGLLLPVLDAFAEARGHIVCRGAGGPGSDELIRVLESLGLALVAGRTLVLEERFFAQLRTEAEEVEVHDRLSPLAILLEEWLERAGERT